MNILVDNCFIVVLTAPEAGDNKYVTLNGNAVNSAYSAYTQNKESADKIMIIANEKFASYEPVLMQGNITLNVEPI